MNYNAIAHGEPKQLSSSIHDSPPSDSGWQSRTYSVRPQHRPHSGENGTSAAIPFVRTLPWVSHALLIITAPLSQ